MTVGKREETRARAGGADAAPTAALVVIGDEILSGRTQDRNIATIARWLGARGIALVEVRIVPDEEAAIIAAVRALKDAVDYLFTTGGIGPTHDDITAEAVARALGRPLVIHDEAFRRLKAHYGAERFTPARQRMARTPQGAALIDNPISVAPGFRVDNVFVLAGVPEIAAAMLDSLEPVITGGPPVLSRVLDVPLPESAFADALAAIAAAHPDVRIGSYPYYRRGPDRAARPRSGGAGAGGGSHRGGRGRRRRAGTPHRGIGRPAPGLPRAVAGPRGERRFSDQSSVISHQ